MIMLLAGELYNSICEEYPELRNTSLNTQLQQLPMFLGSYTVQTLAQAKAMVPGVRNLFPTVERSDSVWSHLVLLNGRLVHCTA